MKTIKIYITPLILLLFGSSLFAQSLSQKYAETITPDDLKELLNVYASDEFMGRETGKGGAEKATNFIRDFYKDHGIKSGIPDGEYFQKVTMYVNKPVTGTLTIGEETFTVGEDDVFVMNSQINKNFNVKSVIYAGWGVEDSLYSDYINLYLRDKVVLVNAGKPNLKKLNFIIPNSWSNPQEFLDLKYKAAMRRSVKALIVVGNNDVFNAAKNYYRSLVDSKRINLSNSKKRPALIVVSEEIGKKIYKKIAVRHTPKKVKIKLSTKFANNTKPIEGNNVLGYIKGNGKSNEYVVISAHLDHLGLDEEGNVFNGADDDGSGTVAVLKIAEAFQKAIEEGHKPRRSILFINLTGEEKGLLGSRYYTDHPVYPLSRTVANLNIDMIGRIDPDRVGDRNYIYLIGSDKLSLDLHNMSEAVNKKCCGLELDYKYNDENDPNRFYYRSDHYNFARFNIPIIFYFNGVHEDYHKITDTPDKIEYDLLANRTKLIFNTAWEIANRSERIKLNAIGEMTESVGKVEVVEEVKQAVEEAEVVEEVKQAVEEAEIVEEVKQAVEEAEVVEEVKQAVEEAEIVEEVKQAVEEAEVVEEVKQAVEEAEIVEEVKQAVEEAEVVEEVKQAVEEAEIVEEVKQAVEEAEVVEEVKQAVEEAEIVEEVKQAVEEAEVVEEVKQAVEKAEE